MILQDEQIVINLKTLVMTSHDTPAPRYQLDPEGITGWFDGAPMRRSDSPRPVQWGSFEVPGYLGSRLISITGTAIARNAMELTAMRDIFTSTLTKGDFATLEVSTTSAGTRTATVGLEGTPNWTVQTDKFASWKLDLFAPDPRQYGYVEAYTYRGSNVGGGLDYPIDYPIDYGSYEVGDSAAVVNAGNVEAWPVLIAEGNMPDGFKVTNGKGDWVSYNGPVSFNSPVRIDFAAGTASQRGTDKSANLSSRDWFPIPPHSPVMPRFSYPNPGLGQEGWIRFEVRDTWI